MNTRLCKRAALVSLIAAVSLIPAVVAQTAAAPKEDPKNVDATKLDKFIVTGSLIKRIEGEGATPLLTDRKSVV